MNQALGIMLAELAKQTPVLVIDLIQLLSKEEATDADWDALRAKWSKSYAQKEAEAEARLAAQGGA
jgi:hypothetical protein